jgi:hypothetical protein
MKYKIVFSATMVLLSLLNCDIRRSSEIVNEQQLIGIYKPNFDAGIDESIELMVDSIYIHYFKSKDSIEYFDTNRWDYRCVLNDSTKPMILFYGFINRYPMIRDEFSTSSAAKIDTIPYKWETYIFKKGDIIDIEKTPFAYQYYRKQ